MEYHSIPWYAMVRTDFILGHVHHGTPPTLPWVGHGLEGEGEGGPGKFSQFDRICVN